MRIDLYNNKTLYKQLYKEIFAEKESIFYDDQFYDATEMGNEVKFLGKDINNKKFLPRDDHGKFMVIKCPRCGRKETSESHDPCIANLPGVLNACCGHGKEEGYIMFENGIIIRGNFTVEDKNGKNF
jgi:hypothetical protein